ncbi:MAG: alpha/beta fold hydrolase [Alphaproteobacteria bacterium]|nr:alpha/beta fold hydrolase [Alphaproteobacteria bacterium]
MPYSSRNGLNIHYEVHGDGPPMVFAHANPFDRRLWTYQVARFSPFFRCIVVDLRGYGLSDKPENLAFTLKDMTHDVLGVCDDEGIQKAIFVGCSVGSGIAMLAATEYTDRVAAAVMVGGSSTGPSDVESIVSGIQQEKLAEYLMTLMRGYVAPGFADTPLGNYLLKLFVEDAKSLSANCIRQIFRARASYDMTDRLPHFRVPALVINGEYDNSLAKGTQTAKLIPGCTHRILPNTGHACSIEDPQAFDAALIDFLRAHQLYPA